jgi:hypothetical protein
MVSRHPEMHYKLQSRQIAFQKNGAGSVLRSGPALRFVGGS